MDVRAFGSWTSAPKSLFFQDFEGLTEVFAPGCPQGYPRGRPPGCLFALDYFHRVNDEPQTSTADHRRETVQGGCDHCQELSGDPNPQYFVKSTVVQMGGVLPHEWEVYCWASLSSKLRSQEGTAIHMGGVLPYKVEVHCNTFSKNSRGWGF